PAICLVAAGAAGNIIRIAYFDCGTCGAPGSGFGVAGAFAAGAPPSCSRTPRPLWLRGTPGRAPAGACCVAGAPGLMMDAGCRPRPASQDRARLVKKKPAA